MSAAEAGPKPVTVITEEGVRALRAQLRGPLLEPAAPGYEARRRVHNGMIDRRPRLIVCCADVADVIHSVNFAREQGLLLAIRGGGHNGAGLGTVDGGLVVDLGDMKGTRVDPAGRTVRVEGGCTWSDVDHATHAFGLAVPNGFVSSTGVGGLTLGGGIGYLVRKYGLTIDSLLGVDVVLADGRLVTASADENEDLFWAVRGGGGNFGVVTSFLFRLHPVDQVYAGPIFWPIDQAEALMAFWRDFIRTQEDDLNGWFGFVSVPPAAPFPEAWHGQTMCALVWCYTGPLEKGEASLAPVRAFSPPAIDFAGPIAWPALQSMFDALYPPGLQWYWKADYFEDLTDEAIRLHVAHGSQLPTPLSTMHLYGMGGAQARVGRTDTAYSHRDARFCEVIVAVSPNPSDNDRMMGWANAYWQALHPLSTGGAYLNMVMDEGHDRVQASYRENYARLAEIKARYDPHNLFRVNQNIRPAEAADAE